MTDVATISLVCTLVSAAGAVYVDVLLHRRERREICLYVYIYIEREIDLYT